MDLEITVLLSQALTTFFLTGVIFVTQVSQYPSFADFNPETFQKSHDAYRIRVSWVVMVPMLIEAAGAVALMVITPSYTDVISRWLGLFFLATAWLSTFLLQVPLHERLSQGFDHHAIKSLVLTNWLRTFAWFVRSLIVMVWLTRSLEA